MNKIFTIIILVIFTINLCTAKSKDSLKLIKMLHQEFPGIKVQAMESREDYQFIWKLIIPQKLDHLDLNSKTFPQQILLYHKSFKKPNVLVTEGYMVADRIYEASMILDANQFSVEYRFFGESLPEIMDWKKLNHKQALEDLHQIKTSLSKIYKKSWLATGISKGGTTAALYSLTYPKDLSATIAYVAPFPLAQEDPRTIDHYQNKVSTKECRTKVLSFQRTMLKYRSELIQKLNELEIRDSVMFNLDKNRVIDFTAMEYPFSFWQWGFSCDDIPSVKATAQEVFDHIEEVVDFNYYDNKSCELFLPAYYQFMTEFGYYGFDTSGISDLLVYSKLSNLEFCPKDADLSYHPEYMKQMHDKATHESKNIIYIYGGLDTWTACAVHPEPTTNAIKMVKYNGGHRIRLRDFSDSEKQKVYQSLKKWMKAKVKDLPY